MFPAWAEQGGNSQRSVPAPSVSSSDAYTRFGAMSRREPQGREWGTMLKRQRENKKGGADIHILWIKNPVKRKYAASPTTDRIFNAVDLSFNVYSNRQIEPQVQNQLSAPVLCSNALAFTFMGDNAAIFKSQL